MPGILPQQVAPPPGFNHIHLRGLPPPPPHQPLRPYTAAGTTPEQDTGVLEPHTEPWQHSSHNLASSQVTSLPQTLLK